MAENTTCDVLIVGGGVAGLSAGIFTARHGLETAVLHTESSLLRRNSHLENFPGFPAGVNSRLLLKMMRDQAEAAGCQFAVRTVSRVARTDDTDESETEAADATGFVVETEDGDTWESRYVLAATKNEVAYLDGFDDLEIIDRGKLFVGTDDRGRTGVEGLYAAGRMAGKPHQTIVAAGHGAEVAVALLEDIDRPFYHDWVAPDRYFTGRDREVPPGCEEIGEAERLEREEASLRAMREYFAEPYPETPEQHPSVRDE